METVPEDVKLVIAPDSSSNEYEIHQTLKEKGIDVNYKELLEEIIQRDYNDSHRAIAPLKQADDAILCDTSELTLEESIELIINTIKDNI